MKKLVLILLMFPSTFVMVSCGVVKNRHTQCTRLSPAQAVISVVWNLTPSI